MSEKARRAQQRARSLNDVEQLLYRRRQTARVLGEISIATIQRLEKAGKLTKVRLAGAPNGVVFHRAAEVHALAEGGESDAAPRAREDAAAPDLAELNRQ